MVIFGNNEGMILVYEDLDKLYEYVVFLVVCCNFYVNKECIK